MQIAITAKRHASECWLEIDGNGRVTETRYPTAFPVENYERVRGTLERTYTAFQVSVVKLTPLQTWSTAVRTAL